MKFLVSSALLAAVCTMLTTAQAAESIIVLERADGETFEVPLAGPGRDPRAEQLAREIQALDRKIAQGIGGWETGTPPDDPVRAEMLKIAKEARNDAIADLDLALTVARITSAGTLDDEVVGRAEENTRSAETILNTRPPSSILVETDISTSLADAHLYYMSAHKRRMLSEEWSSYTAGERLNIGRYVFRVEQKESGEPAYEEFVLVLSDPTQKRLTPMRAPGS